MKTALIIYLVVSIVGFALFLYFFIGTLNRVQANLGYQIKDQKVFYVSVAGGSLGNTFTEVIDADPKTFQELSKKGMFGKDKNFVFIKHLKIEKADTETFKNLNGTLWSLDHQSVFFAQRIVETADPKSFEIIEVEKRIVNYQQTSIDFAPYGKDKTKVFFYDKVVEAADPSTFRAVGTENTYETYGFDKSSVYFNGELIPDADPSTFEEINEDSDKD